MAQITASDKSNLRFERCYLELRISLNYLRLAEKVNNHISFFLYSSRAGFFFLTQACLLSADFVDLRFATIDSGVSAISGLRRFTLRYNWLQPQKVNQKDLRCREMAKIETACLNPANALHDLLRGLFNGNQSQFDSGIFYFKGIKELTFL